MGQDAPRRTELQVGPTRYASTEARTGDLPPCSYYRCAGTMLTGNFTTSTRSRLHLADDARARHRRGQTLR